MAYHANRNDAYLSKEDEKKRSDYNNTKNVRNAAEVAVASGVPEAQAVGAAVKGADKVTGGKASEAIGKGMTRANKMPIAGKHMQDLSNKLGESVSDKIGQAARIKNLHDSMKNNQGANSDDNEEISGLNKNKENESLPPSKKDTNGEGENVSKVNKDSINSPESGDGTNKKNDAINNDSKGNDSSFLDDNDDSDSSKKSKGLGHFIFKSVLRTLLFLFAPAFLVFLVVILMVTAATSIFSNFDDAFGISQTTGESTGDTIFDAATEEQQKFYDRVNDIVKEYSLLGKNVDALKVVSVIHILNSNTEKYGYSEVDNSMIREVCDTMFDGSTYSDETFKENLKNSFFAKYVPNSSEEEREQMVDDVFSYIEDYYNFIGKDQGLNCSTTGGSSGTCAYDIKGYYIRGKGNVIENAQINQLYVRLMQCGIANGHNYGGTFGLPLEGEELVPFEKYILGVAYQEIGPSSPEHAIKAQLVAARSFALARHVDMRKWRTLKQEGDKWILQAAGCTQDQVYCDPDKGCSSNSGQWGQIHSGLSYARGFSRKPLAEDAPLRKYASEVEGEVLVNAEGNIIYAGYLDTDQRKWISQAKSGLNYKQILLQTYNQGRRASGAADIVKANCGENSSSNIYCTDTSTVGEAASGAFVNWRQNRGPWINTRMGTSGKTIRQIGCLVTSVSIQIARSGQPTKINDFNPGTFVEFLNRNGGFQGGNFVWGAATKACPTFKYQGKIYLSGKSREQKLQAIKNLISQPGVYVVAEVKGNTGQHWVAIDSVSGDSVKMMDPATDETDLWSKYNWKNTSQLSYYKVG